MWAVTWCAVWTAHHKSAGPVFKVRIECQWCTRKRRGGPLVPILDHKMSHTRRSVLTLGGAPGAQLHKVSSVRKSQAYQQTDLNALRLRQRHSFNIHLLSTRFPTSTLLTQSHTVNDPFRAQNNMGSFGHISKPTSTRSNKCPRLATTTASVK